MKFNRINAFKIARNSIASVIFGGDYFFGKDERWNCRATAKNKATAKGNKVEFAFTVQPCGIDATFTEFDWAVFDAFHSELAAGNSATTITRIGRILGAGAGEHKLPTKVAVAIFNSIEQMSNTLIEVPKNVFEGDAKKPLPRVGLEAVRKLGGDFDKLDEEYQGRLLNVTPVLEYDADGFLIGGKIKIEPSPVYKIANTLDHISSVGADYFQQGRATVQTIAVRHYLLRNVMAIKGHSRSTHITFANLIRQCGLGELDRFQIRKIRDQVISPTLDLCKLKGLIADWQFLPDNPAPRQKITGVEISPKEKLPAAQKPQSPRSKATKKTRIKGTEPPHKGHSTPA